MIKVGGFFEFIIECFISNYYCLIIEENIMLFGVDLFICMVILEVLFFVIFFLCGFGDWMVCIEVYLDMI